MIVLDKSNRKMWEASLTYTIPAGLEEFVHKICVETGEGPCVEHGDTLYVYDCSQPC